MMPQAVVSPMIVIVMTLEVSFMLPPNIYSTGIIHDDHHVTIVIYLQHRPLVSETGSGFIHLKKVLLPLPMDKLQPTG
jgi:hypothetical protein